MSRQSSTNPVVHAKLARWQSQHPWQSLKDGETESLWFDLLRSVATVPQRTGALRSRWLEGLRRVVD